MFKCGLLKFTGHDDAKSTLKILMGPVRPFPDLLGGTFCCFKLVMICSGLELWLLTHHRLWCLSKHGYFLSSCFILMTF